MKKILLFLILLCIVLPGSVYAVQDSFYEGEYIPNAYLIKLKNGTGKYEQMRVFRRKLDNRVAYCLELWQTMNPNKTLTGSYSSSTLTKEIQNKLFLIAYYGYGYKDHTDLKWYAVTQYMIWSLLEPDSTIYFTDTLNGNRTNKYDSEIAEINRLVADHNVLPNLETDVELKYNEEYRLVDTNNILNQYEILNYDNLNINVNNNEIKVKTDKVGKSRLLIRRVDKMYTNPSTIYVDNNGQDLLLPGTFSTQLITVNFNLKATDLYINKLDKDTLEANPQGDASFKDTTFELYDNNHNCLKTAVIDDNKQIVFKNIAYGTYYLKEVKAGIGYLLNDEEIEIKVDDSNTINITNQVIKNKIIINKYIRNNNDTILKEEASFIVLDNSGKEIFDFLTTDGSYEFDLPYGTYLVKQISGDDNYKMVDNFEISVTDDGKKQIFELYDDEIIEEVGDIIYDVPDTYKDAYINMLDLLILVSFYIMKRENYEKD